MKILRIMPCLGLAVAACGDDNNNDARDLSVRFVPIFEGRDIDCTSDLSGLGATGTVSVGMSDLRFYVSNVRLYDAAGAQLQSTLDRDPFQYEDDGGAVVLIDLTSNQVGTCADTAIAFAEGTARTNDRITGIVEGTPARITFDIGLPQAMMKAVIANHTAEDAPSPLAEMFWSWATGYRHLVFNFTVSDLDTAGEGYLHIGSRDCGGDGARALTDRTTCGFVNTPTVEIDGFDPDIDTIGVDIGALIDGLDFVAPIYNTEPPFEQIGEGIGVSCHSSPQQSDCTQIFENLGLDFDTGTAVATTNRVFVRR